MVKIDDRVQQGTTEPVISDSLRDGMGCVYTFSLFFSFSFLFILAGGREWPEGDAGEQYPML
jgi:hypothetical protein